MGIFDDRKTPRSSYSNGNEERNRGKSGVYYTSQMQAILETKENNERKAANLLSDYLTSLASKTYDERLILSNMDKMLNGFTTEEKLRITSMALAQALCKIA